MLKQLTWRYVIDHPALANQQHGQCTMIQTLFDIYYEAAVAKKWRMLPAAYREEAVQLHENDEIVRLIADMIARMTDLQALRTFQRLTGLAPGSVLDRIFA